MTAGLQLWNDFPSNVRKRIKKAIRKRKCPTTIAGRLYSAAANIYQHSRLGAVPIALRRKLRESHHAYLTISTQINCKSNLSKSMDDTSHNLRKLNNTYIHNLISTPPALSCIILAPKHIESVSSQSSHLTFGRSILHSPLPNTHTSPSQMLKSITSPRSQANFQASISNPEYISIRVLERSRRKRKRSQRTIHNIRDNLVLEQCKRKHANTEIMLLAMQRSIIKKSLLPTSSRGLRICAQALHQVR